MEFSNVLSIVEVDLIVEVWREGGDDCAITFSDGTDEIFISEDRSFHRQSWSSHLLTSNSFGIEGELVLGTNKGTCDGRTWPFLRS